MGLYLGKRSMTTSWQPYVVKETFQKLELTANKSWCWCTSIDSGAFRSVAAFQREVIIESVKLLPVGTTLIYFKGDESGEIYDKCTF